MMKIIPKVEKIHEALIKQGFTKRALAKRAQIGEVTAIQVCNGNRFPSPPIAKRILDALEVEFDEIFMICKGEKEND